MSLGRLLFTVAIVILVCDDSVNSSTYVISITCFKFLYLSPLIFIQLKCHFSYRCLGVGIKNLIPVFIIRFKSAINTGAFSAKEICSLCSGRFSFKQISLVKLRGLRYTVDLSKQIVKLILYVLTV